MSSTRHTTQDDVSSFLSSINSSDACNVFDNATRFCIFSSLSLDELVAILALSTPGSTDKALVAAIRKQPHNGFTLFTAANNDPNIYRVIRGEPSLEGQLSQHEQLQLTHLHNPRSGIGRDMM